MRSRNRFTIWVIVTLALGLAAVIPPAQAEPKRAVQLTSVDHYRDVPTALTKGTDGNVWFLAGSSVGKLTPAGAITSYLLDWQAAPVDLVADEGGIWFTDRRSIGRLSYSGQLTTYGWELDTDPTQLAIAPDGTVWFAGDRGRVGTISQSGNLNVYLVKSPEGLSYPEATDLAVAGDGSVWLALTEVSLSDGDFVSLVRLRSDGAVLAQLPRLPSNPDTAPDTDTDTDTEAGYRFQSLVRGPDGAVWYSRTRLDGAAQLTGVVGRLDDSAYGPSWAHRAIGQLAAGADDALWFALPREPQSDLSVGRLTTSGSYSEYAVGRFTEYGGGLIGGPGNRIWGTTDRGIANITITGAAGTTFDAPVDKPYWPWTRPFATRVTLSWLGSTGATSYDLELEPGGRRLSSDTTTAEFTGLEPGLSYRLQNRGRKGELVGLPRTSVFTTQPERAGGPAADFTGDGRADVAVYRPSAGAWFIRGRPLIIYGRATDVPVPADYDGDGSADIALFRPSDGRWYVRGKAAVAYGRAGDIPVPADYTGDGKADIAVFRPSTGTWYVRGRAAVAYGAAGDIPVPGNFLGDRRTDVAVWRPSTGTWYRKGAGAIRFGQVGDRPLILDRNGDGRHEIAVFDPYENLWSIRGEGYSFARATAGLPLPGAFDARRGDELVSFTPWSGRWEIGEDDIVYGMNGDIPV